MKAKVEEVAEAKAPNRTKKTDILKVDPRNIRIVEGFNVREEMGDIEGLLESILAVGLQVPLRGQKVRGEDKFDLIEGHRRLAAINLGIERGHDFQFVELMPFSGSEEDKVFTMLITGTGQKILNEMEQANGVTRLINLGYSIEEIAVKIIKSESHIKNLISMTKLPKSVRDKVSEGEISGNTALKISRIEKDPKKQKDIVFNAIAKAKETKEKNPMVKSLFLKPVTAKDVAELNKETLSQKMVKALNILKQEKVKNDKVTLLKALTTKKNLSVEDLVALCTK